MGRSALWWLAALAAVLTPAPGVSVAVPLAPPSPVTAARVRAAATSAHECEPFGVRSDVTGDNRPDVVVGVPRTGRSGGAVDVIDARTGVGQRGRWPGRGRQAGRPGDRFGAAVAVGDVDGDLCSDLVVGAPGRDGTGAVLIFRGGRGLFRHVLRLPYHGARGDRFGAAVAVNSQTEDLWVGAPGSDVSGHRDAGAVLDYRAGSSQAFAMQLVGRATQDTPGVDGAAQTGAGFGEVLSAAHDLKFGVLVGQPHEDVSGQVDAGMVTLLSSPRPGRFQGRAVTQASAGVPGTPERGDHFGAAVGGGCCARLGRDIVGWVILVGVPDEDLRRHRDAGMVVAFADIDVRRGTLGRPTGLTQGTPGVHGVVEDGDRFGAAVAVGALRHDHRLYAAIGAPGEDVGRTEDSGSVTMLAVPPAHPIHSTVLTEGQGLPGARRPGDRAGASLSVVITDDFSDAAGTDSLAVGAPGTDVRALRDRGVVDQLSSPVPSRARRIGPAAATGARVHYGAVLPPS